ncbi:hypothetical protein B0H13DRAFT_1865058 [Mycena leptocephala]|nr:hypothetical protein B0H13DRAFT_1865058 [Mycena leptocephala]
MAWRGRIGEKTRNGRPRTAEDSSKYIPSRLGNRRLTLRGIAWFELNCLSSLDQVHREWKHDARAAWTAHQHVRNSEATLGTSDPLQQAIQDNATKRTLREAMIIYIMDLLINSWPGTLYSGPGICSDFAILQKCRSITDGNYTFEEILDASFATRQKVAIHKPYANRPTGQPASVHNDSTAGVGNGPASRNGFPDSVYDSISVWTKIALEEGICRQAGNVRKDQISRGKRILRRRAEADKLSGSRASYCSDLDVNEDPDEELPENAYSVDAFGCGNWTRFLNPNLQIISVVYDTMPKDNMPYLAVVATKDIPAYEEPNLDYNPAHQAEWELERFREKSRSKKNRSKKQTRCLCGSFLISRFLIPVTRYLSSGRKTFKCLRRLVRRHKDKAEVRSLLCDVLAGKLYIWHFASNTGKLESLFRGPNVGSEATNFPTGFLKAAYWHGHGKGKHYSMEEHIIEGRGSVESREKRAEAAVRGNGKCTLRANCGNIPGNTDYAANAAAYTCDRINCIRNT